jgi:hypothetical protein
VTTLAASGRSGRTRVLGRPGGRPPFAEHARGDRERRVDKRDLDVPVTVGSPLDERQGGQDPLSVG